MLLHLSRSRRAACVRQLCASLFARPHRQLCAYSTKPAADTFYASGAVSRDVLQAEARGEDIGKATRTRRPRKPKAATASTIEHDKKSSPRKRQRLVATADEMDAIAVSDDDWQSRVELPPIDDWNTIFPSHYTINTRLTLHNRETARTLAEAYVPEGSVGKTIIEAYPGPGTLSRAILALPKERVKRLILVDNYPPFLNYLQPLAKLDPRVTIIRGSPSGWQTYDDLRKAHLPDDLKVDWDAGVNDRLSFICHLPMGTTGEMFFQQWVRCIPDKQWLFAFGRVPLNIVMTEELWIRATASVLERNLRSKASVITEATCQAKAVLPHNLRPHSEHFFPARKVKGSLVHANLYGTIATTITPKSWQIIEEGKMDTWDYVVRHMFSRKTSTVDKALPYLAPGALSLLPKVFPGPTLPPSQAIYPKVQVRGMQLRDWGILVRAFEDWPFRPQDLTAEGLMQMDANTSKRRRETASQQEPRETAVVPSPWHTLEPSPHMMDVQYYPLAPVDVDALQHIVIQTGVDCLFCGIQATLFIAACAMLARQNNRLCAVTVAIIGLFLSSLVGVVLNMVFYLVQVPTFGWGLDSIWGFLERSNVAITATYRFNYLVSDSIVVWRAWVLWPDSHIAKGLLTLCLGGSLVGVIVECVWSAQDLLVEVPPVRTLMMTVPLLATNIVATVLVGVQVW
ncbi:S-adenosyl-L-methionine-dependent methyltransferase [Schizophyllum fasciatum]